MKPDYTVSATIRMIAPLLKIEEYERAQGTPDDAIGEMLQDVKKLAYKQASKIVQLADIPPTEVEWAESYFARSIIDQISEEWLSLGHEALKKDFTLVYSEFANVATYSGLPSVWKSSQSEAGYLATTLNSLTRITREYETFNLFHFDRTKVLDKLQGQVISAALNATNEILSNHPHLKDTMTGSSILQSFIKHSASTIAAIYRATAIEFIKLYDLSQPAEQRQMQSKGADLDKICASHTEAMKSLSKSALDALEIRVSVAPSKSQSLSPNGF